MLRRSPDVARAAAALGAVALVTLIYARWLHLSNAATASATFLLIVLVVAATSRFWVAALTSVAAMLAFNYFFLPPVGGLSIADPQNWVALAAFLVVSLIASNLAAVARDRTREALSRRDELARLFDLSRDVMLITESREAIAAVAQAIARRFDLEFVAIALPGSTGWDVSHSGATVVMDEAQLSAAFAAAKGTLEFDARARTYAGHRTMEVEGRTVRLVPLRIGTKPVGLLASSGRTIEPGTLDALGGVAAIAIERAQLLEARQAGELMRQSDALKTTLLASIGHDLRTPLTAIRIAATNIKGVSLTAEDRGEQSDLILAEVERLTRLFQNILEMARIDAGAVSADTRWVHPAEIIAAARDQVAHTLDDHPFETVVGDDLPVRLDPRLTATALAHVLENAAQYAPPGTPIELQATHGSDGLTIVVRDRGPGLAPADLPRLFDRFYRGATSKARASGTGMGLWIVRSLLAIQQGRVWAENRPGGGAQFTLVVPAAVKSAGVEREAV